MIAESTEGSQVIGSKCKEAFPEDNINCWPSKKAKEKQPVRY